MAGGCAEAPAGADAKAARTGLASAAKASTAAACGERTAEPLGARAVRVSRVLYTLPEFGLDSFSLSSCGLRLPPAPALSLAMSLMCNKALWMLSHLGKDETDAGTVRLIG